MLSSDLDFARYPVVLTPPPLKPKNRRGPRGCRGASRCAVCVLGRQRHDKTDRGQALGNQHEVICSGFRGVLRGDAGFQRCLPGAVLEPRCEASTSLTISAAVPSRTSSAQSYQVGEHSSLAAVEQRSTTQAGTSTVNC